MFPRADGIKTVTEAPWLSGVRLSRQAREMVAAKTRVKKVPHAEALPEPRACVAVGGGGFCAVGGLLVSDGTMMLDRQHGHWTDWPLSSLVPVRLVPQEEQLNLNIIVSGESVRPTFSSRLSIRLLEFSSLCLDGIRFFSSVNVR